MRFLPHNTKPLKTEENEEERKNLHASTKDAMTVVYFPKYVQENASNVLVQCSNRFLVLQQTNT